MTRRARDLKFEVTEVAAEAALTKGSAVENPGAEVRVKHTYQQTCQRAVTQVFQYVWR